MWERLQDEHDFHLLVLIANLLIMIMGQGRVDQDRFSY